MTRLEELGIDRPTGLPIICVGAGPAHGGRSLYKVLDCQDELIVKLFPTEVGKPRVEEEVVNTLKVRSLGIDTPDIRALIEEGDSMGFAYVKLTGETFLEHISDGIEELDAWAERYAFLHRRIHEHRVDGLRPIKEALEERIISAGLDDGTKEQVVDALRALPDDNCVCHGDFHPGNVIVTERGLVTIDWANATAGHCLADVAQTSVLMSVWLPYKVRELNVHLSRRSLEFFRRTYVETYLILSGESDSALDDWVLPIAAARLSEGNPWERDGLLRIIRDRT